MQKRIYKFIISCVLIVCGAASVAAQGRKIIEKQDTSYHAPFYNGFMIYADVAPLATALISTGEQYGYESGIQVDIKHKLFPCIDLGFAGANRTAINDFNFKTSAPYVRLGFDINLMKYKHYSQFANNMFTAGFRVGMSSFKYQYNHMTVTDDYWQSSEELYANKFSSTKLWWELNVGLKVEIAKNIYLGWIGRHTMLVNTNSDGQMSPWFIPGYGVNKSNSWGFSYLIAYHF